MQTARKGDGFWYTHLHGSAVQRSHPEKSDCVKVWNTLAFSRFELPSCEAFNFDLPQRVEMWLASQFIVSKLLRGRTCANQAS